MIMRLTDPAQKRRLRSTLITYGIVLAIAFIYLLSVTLPLKKGEPLWHGIPCVFYEGTEHLFKLLKIEHEGIKCAGCGLSRMLISMVKLDFVSAFWYNPFLFVTGPLLIAYFVAQNIKFIITGKENMGKWQIFLYIEGGLAVLYMILRNFLPI